MQQVLRVDLVLLKHNVDGGILKTIYTAVKKVDAPSILGRRPPVIGTSLRVFSHQQPHHEHGSGLRVTGGVAV